MIGIENLCHEDVYRVMNKMLTEFDHQVRDLQYIFGLSGIKNDSLQRGLMHLREKCEDAAKEVRI